MNSRLHNYCRSISSSGRWSGKILCQFISQEENISSFLSRPCTSDSIPTQLHRKRGTSDNYVVLQSVLFFCFFITIQGMHFTFVKYQPSERKKYYQPFALLKKNLKKKENLKCKIIWLKIFYTDRLLGSNPGLHTRQTYSVH